jgi:hypothetical protein
MSTPPNIRCTRPASLRGNQRLFPRRWSFRLVVVVLSPLVGELGVRRRTSQSGNKARLEEAFVFSKPVFIKRGPSRQCLLGYVLFGRMSEEGYDLQCIQTFEKC